MEDYFVYHTGPEEDFIDDEVDEINDAEDSLLTDNTNDIDIIGDITDDDVDSYEDEDYIDPYTYDDTCTEDDCDTIDYEVNGYDDEDDEFLDDDADDLEDFCESKAMLEFSNDMEASEMVDEFRKSIVKSPKEAIVTKDFYALIKKIYTKNPDQIINALPNIFSTIRFIIVFMAPTRFFTKIILLIIDGNVKKFIRKDEASRLATEYRIEINKVDQEIAKTRDPAVKENLIRYSAYLKNDLERVNQYEGRQRFGVEI